MLNFKKLLLVAGIATSFSFMGIVSANAAGFNANNQNWKAAMGMATITGYMGGNQFAYTNYATGNHEHLSLVSIIQKYDQYSGINFNQSLVDGSGLFATQLKDLQNAYNQGQATYIKYNH